MRLPSQLNLLPLLLSVVSASQLNFLQATPLTCAQSTFSNFFELSSLTSTGPASQFGTFTCGAPPAGLDGLTSGLVLATTTLLDPNKQGVLNGNLDGVLNLLSPASLSLDLVGKGRLQLGSVPHGASFCSCAAVGTDSGKVFFNGKLLFELQRSVTDNILTAALGFATDPHGSSTGGPCTCSPLKRFSLPYTPNPSELQLVIGGLGSLLSPSWLFLGPIDPPKTTKTITKQKTITKTKTIAKTTKTKTLQPKTTTINDEVCVTYSLHFKNSCCPKKFCKSFVSSNKRSAAKGATTTTTTTTLTHTNTKTIRPTRVTTTYQPVVTQHTCLTKVDVPTVFCPCEESDQDNFARLSKAFLDNYKAIGLLGNDVEVHCEGDPKTYYY